MGTLLDTHALIWWVDGDKRLTPARRRCLDDPNEDVHVSAVSAWEIALLYPPSSLIREWTS